MTVIMPAKIGADTMIRKLKPAETKIRISEGNGFTIRVMPTGLKTWLYLYGIEGKRREMNLGEYPSVSLVIAREKFEDARRRVKSGIDPSAEQEQTKQENITASTVAELVDLYLEGFAKENKKTWQEDERMLKKDVVPVLGSMKAKNITRSHILNLIDGMKHRGGATTLNTFKIIRRMFKFAAKRGIVELSPCHDFEKGDELPVVPTRERNLSMAEIKTFWNGLDNAGISRDVVRALKLILTTCQRPGEVAAMHRSQIKGRWWEFMPKQTRITKEKPRPHRMYLSDMALDLIGDGDGYVFPSPTTGRHITERSLPHAIRRNIKDYTRRKPSADPNADKLTNMEDVQESKKLEMDHFVPHDLRRTGATFLSRLGFIDEIVDAVLAHQKMGTIKVYNQNRYDKEKQAAMEAWERMLGAIITGRNTDNIVSTTAEMLLDPVKIRSLAENAFQEIENGADMLRTRDYLKQIIDLCLAVE